jgi:hypothetical protein
MSRLILLICIALSLCLSPYMASAGETGMTGDASYGMQMSAGGDHDMSPMVDCPSGGSCIGAASVCAWACTGNAVVDLAHPSVSLAHVPRELYALLLTQVREGVFLPTTERPPKIRLL